MSTHIENLGITVYIPEHYKDLFQNTKYIERGSVEHNFILLLKGRMDCHRSTFRYFCWSGGIGEHDEFARSMIFCERMATDGDTYMREQAAFAYGRLFLRGFRQAEKAIHSLLNDSKSSVRCAISRGLEFDDKAEAFPIIENLYNDTSEDVVASISDWVWRHHEIHPDMLELMLTHNSPIVKISMLESIFLDTKEEMAALGIEALKRLCKDKNSDVRAAAIPHSICFEDQELDEIVKQAASDSSPVVRAAAIRVIGRLDVDYRIATLEPATRDVAQCVREAATEGLRSIPGEEVARILLKCANDSASMVRRHVAIGLQGRTTEPMFPALKKLASDSADAVTRLAATKCISEFYTPEREQIVLRALQDKKKNVSAGAKKILEAWAKEEKASRDALGVARSGAPSYLACKSAFQQDTRTASQNNWKDYITTMKTLEISTSGSTKNRPTIRLLIGPHVHAFIFPIGTAEWMRVEIAEGKDGPSKLTYAIGSSEDVQAWWSKQKDAEMVGGAGLAQQMGIHPQLT